MTPLERLDSVKNRLATCLAVGKTYKLGIAVGGTFSHYEIAKVRSKTVHSIYSTSYFCCYEGNTACYRWDKDWYDWSTRIVSAEEIYDD